MLFGWDLSINAFDDFTQTAYADGNMQNAMGACRKKNFIILVNLSKAKGVKIFNS